MNLSNRRGGEYEVKMEFMMRILPRVMKDVFDSCMAALILPIHTEPDGHGLDGSVKKARLPEWTASWIILVFPCTLELVVTD